MTGELSAAVSYSQDGAAGGGPRSGCTWRQADAEYADFPFAGLTWPHTDRDGIVWHIYVRTCPGETPWPVAIPDTTPTDLRPLALHQLEHDVLPKPAVSFTPFDPDHGWSYVKLPIDFRIPSGQWQPFSVTARAGPVWATVTATPATLTFDPGDQHNDAPPPTVCQGDAPTVGYEPAHPGACSYRYLHASSTSTHDGYHFLTHTTITWTINWTSSTGEGGPLAAFTTTTDQPLAIAEIQAIITCTGPQPRQGSC